jgi:hypothetical protein
MAFRCRDPLLGVSRYVVASVIRLRSIGDSPLITRHLQGQWLYRWVISLDSTSAVSHVQRHLASSPYTRSGVGCRTNSRILCVRASAWAIYSSAFHSDSPISTAVVLPLYGVCCTFRQSVGCARVLGALYWLYGGDVRIK